MSHRRSGRTFIPGLTLRLATQLACLAGLLPSVAQAVDLHVGTGQTFATIAAAHAAAGNGDRIILHGPVHTEASITISKLLIISGNGNGPQETILQAATTRGTAPAPTLTITANVSLEKLTIRHGNAIAGGGVQVSGTGQATITNCILSQNDASAVGGGLYADGNVTMINCIVTDNTAGSGGGIATTRALTMRSSTVHANSASAEGGGVHLDSTAAGITFAITNSTISNNRAGTNGGGIRATATGAAATGASTLSNVTIADNHCDNDDNASGTGGGILQVGNHTVTLVNSLIGNNTRGSGFSVLDDLSGSFTSNDYNLIRTTSGATIGGTTTNNVIGQDPLLDSLSNAGGAQDTPTQRPQDASPARNRIPDGTNGIGTGQLAFDQRGLARPQGSAAEIGAHEVSELRVVSITRSNASPTNASSVGFTVTFSEAVTGVNSFDFEFGGSGVSGAAVTGVSGSGTTYAITVSTGSGDGTLRLDIDDDDTIENADGALLGDLGLNNGDFSSGESYVLDRTAPSATLSYGGAALTQTPITVNATLSEASGAFTASDISTANCTVSGFSGGGASYSFVLTPSGQGAFSAFVVGAAFSDAAGNTSTASNTVSATLDSVPPIVTELTPLARADGATEQAFRVVWSESVSLFDSAGDVSVQHSGTASGGVTITPVSGNEHIVTVTGLSGSGSFTITVNGNSATDSAGNLNLASSASTAVVFSAGSGGSGGGGTGDGGGGSGGGSTGDGGTGDGGSGGGGTGGGGTGDGGTDGGSGGGGTDGGGSGGDDLPPEMSAACGGCASSGFAPLLSLIGLAAWKQQRFARRRQGC